MNLFDPTTNLVPQAPKPRTTGIVSASLGDSLYVVTLAGEAITMRSAGGNSLSVGTEVSVVWAGGDMPWCCAATAGYRSLVPVPLADFASSKPGSVLMAYLLKDNPRNYAYRQGISLGAESTNNLLVRGPDGDGVYPVEYAGVARPASALAAGDPVLLHQVEPGRWIVIGGGGGASVVLWEDFAAPRQAITPFDILSYLPVVSKQAVVLYIDDFGAKTFTPAFSYPFWNAHSRLGSQPGYGNLDNNVAANLESGNTTSFNFDYLDLLTYGTYGSIAVWWRQITGPYDGSEKISVSLTWDESGAPQSFSFERALDVEPVVDTNPGSEYFGHINNDSSQNIGYFDENDSNIIVTATIEEA